MLIKPISDPAFTAYGQIINGYDFKPLIDMLTANTPKPDRVIYAPGDEGLEGLPVSAELRDNYYGGMPIQVGYCNGHNRVTSSFEYHRDSEVNITESDVVLVVAKQQDIIGSELDTSKAEAFLLPAGMAVEFYATTLHYAPCDSDGADGFRVAVVLPKGTNTKKPTIAIKNDEDKMLFACNKWLLTLPDTFEARAGAHVGLKGDAIIV